MDNFFFSALRFESLRSLPSLARPDEDLVVDSGSEERRRRGWSRYRRSISVPPGGVRTDRPTDRPTSFIISCERVRWRGGSLLCLYRGAKMQQYSCVRTFLLL